MRLKDARINSGLTQKQLSEATGISIRTLQDYEQKRRKLSGCKYDKLIKLATTLNTTIDELIKD